MGRRSKSINDVKYKALVRERDDYKCVECGMSHDEHVAKYGSMLEVHRLIPSCDYKYTEWCVTMCRRCHAKMPRDCKSIIFKNPYFPKMKGVYGVMASCYGQKSAAMKRDLIAFTKEMQRKYGELAPYFFFGDKHPKSYYVKAMKRIKKLAYNS